MSEHVGPFMHDILVFHWDVAIAQMLVGASGTWTAAIRVPPSDASAEVLPTPAPTPTPNLPPPGVATLPLTLTGEGLSDGYSDQFTAGVKWHYTARCVNPPNSAVDPYSLMIRVDQTSDTSFLGYVSVGHELDMSCDGTAVDTNTVHPGSYPAGIYGWDVFTDGDWTITVLAE